MPHLFYDLDFTVSVFIVFEGKVLLVHHRKLGRWLPIGGHIALGGVEPKFVRNLLTALDRPDLIDIATGPSGRKQAPVKEFLRETFARRSRSEWESWLADKDVCTAPVLDLKEAFDHPQTAARDMVVRDPDGNLHIGIPIKFRNEPGRIDPELPAMGQHTGSVLGDLGFSAQEIEAASNRS